MRRPLIFAWLCGILFTTCIANAAHAAMSIGGSQKVCPGANETYTASSSTCASGYTVQWSISPSSAGGIIPGVGSANVSWSNSFTGTATITATARTGDGQCDQASLEVTSLHIDKPVLTVTPTFAPCGTITTLTLSVQHQDNVDELEWNVPAGWTAPPPGSPEVVFISTDNLTAGNVSVTARNSCSILGVTSDEVFVSRTPQPGTISGPTTIERKSTGHYSIAPVSGATSYNWSVSGNEGASLVGGQGTTAVDVHFPLEGSANVCVTVTNACGTGPSRCAAITVTCSAPVIATCSAPIWVGGYGTNDGWGDADATPRYLADLNGDGLSDVVGISHSGVEASLCTGSSFAAGSIWTVGFSSVTGWFSQSSEPRMFGDVNGDHREDIVGFSPSSGTWVALSAGTAFGAATEWSSGFDGANGWGSLDANPRYLTDVDHDGKADLVGFSNGGGVVVALSTGSSFGAAPQWSGGFDHANGWNSQDATPRYLADVNGDGWPDIVGFSHDGVDVALNQHSGNVSLHAFGAASVYHIGFTTAEGWSSNSVYPRFVIDVNNDGRADIVGFSADGVSVSLATPSGGFGAPSEWVRAMGTSQGWSDQNSYPRTIGRFDCDPYPDLVGFGASGVLVSLNEGGTSFTCPATISIGFDHAQGWSSQAQFPRFLANVRPNTHADIVGFSASGVAVEACGAACPTVPPHLPGTSPWSRVATVCALVVAGTVVLSRRARPAV